MKATTLWESPNEGATDSSGFTAFPGGYRDGYGDFNSIGEDGIFWSASEYNLNAARARSLYYDDSYADRVTSINDKRNGLSIRCVRD